MANKNINVRLSLQDRLTGPLKKANGQIRQLSREGKSAVYSIRAMGNSAKAAAKTTVTAMGAIAGAVGGLAAKTGLSEALDLEGYKVQLETATKDTQKASQIMQYAINLANRTPFEGGQLVEGAAKFEAMGMSAQRWLTLAGDMAAATNKDFDQSVEALIDAQTGELERLMFSLAA